MPTYDYKCENCGHTFEAFQSMKEENLKKCPVCGEETLKRLISAGAGLIFKGSGFYLTDYKNSSNKSSESASESSSSKSTASEKASDTSSSTTEKSTEKTSKSESKSSSPSSEKTG